MLYIYIYTQLYYVQLVVVPLVRASESAPSCLGTSMKAFHVSFVDFTISTIIFDLRGRSTISAHVHRLWICSSRTFIQESSF